MSEFNEKIQIQLPEGEIPKKQRKRIDQFLAAEIDSLSRSRIQSLIFDNNISLNGRVLNDPARRVKPGDTIIIDIPPPEPLDVLPENIPLDIIYEDNHLLVVNKPSGMVVHPAPGNLSGTLVNAIMYHCGENLSGIGGVKRPGIVHRIDKDTSGLLVIAKTDDAHQGLSEKFAAHDIIRQYQAVVWGLPEPLNGTINGNIGRHPVDRKKMAIVKPPHGKSATTHYKTLQLLNDGLACLIQCQLETGRTHQIRVHMTSIGHPLIGDPVYGKNQKSRISILPKSTQQLLQNFNRQALHAKTLGFIHPVTGEEMFFECDLSNDINELIGKLS